MKKRTRIILKTALPLLLGVFLIWYSIGLSTPSERVELWESISNANPFWVALSLFLGVLSHWSRAYRWKYLLNPLGYHPGISISFMAVMAGYLANLGIPRSGEVLRAASLSTYRDVPFEKGFGTIISERMIDLCMLLFIVALAAIFQSDNLFSYFSRNNINPFMSLLVLLGFLVLGLVFLKIIKRSTNKFLVKIKDFATGLLKGMRSILHLENKKAFFFHTFFIWTMYVLMFYVLKFAVPETADLNFDVILLAFVVGSFAISVTNGGIGIYPIAIAAVLVGFGIDRQAGEAFGWIVWGSQTFMNILLGGLSLLFMPILRKEE
ncbi:MAG TPA: lysylphosphatidylglycerol synthase transmembrane domain-containing protein [Flavobacteriaceae bacterium]|nr:lysylphosphatidylglycerol synthase transmembrane domain-containing protein [Flavobacteriaceae bacterium]